jgi:hypothetical protein
MTTARAEELIRKYGDALAKKPKGALARKRSDLPAPPHEILLAAKITIAFLEEHNQLSKEIQDQLIRALIWLPSFIDDHVANGVNQGDPNFDDIRSSYSNLIAECASGGYIGWTLNNFVKAIKELDHADPLYGHWLRSLAEFNF